MSGNAFIVSMFSPLDISLLALAALPFCAPMVFPFNAHGLEGSGERYSINLGVRRCGGAGCAGLRCPIDGLSLSWLKSLSQES